MAETNFLSAFTPHKEDPEDDTLYHVYPPFVNFTQVGNKVKVMVRSRDQLNEKGWAVTTGYADIEMPVKEFKSLLEQALKRLHEE